MHRFVRVGALVALVIVVVFVSAVPAFAAPKAKPQNKPIELQTTRVLAAAGNSLDFTSFQTGDIACIFSYTPKSVFWDGHNGTFDKRLFKGSDTDLCFWSANTKPVNGVQMEAPAYYRLSPYGFGRRLPGITLAQAEASIAYCASQKGKGYNLFSSKTDTRSWYCSKLSWWGLKQATGVDVDTNGGFWVTPNDLYASTKLQTFAAGQ